MKGRTFVIFDLLLRFILPLLLFSHTVLTTFLFIVVDLSDGLGFSFFTEIRRITYQKIDKLLDFYFYAVSFFVFTGTRLARYVFLFLIVWRFVGVLILFVRGNEGLLVYFPNAVEPFFVIYVLGFFLPAFRKCFQVPTIIVFVIILLLVKLGQEYIMHRKGFCFRTTFLNYLGFEDLAVSVSPPPLEVRKRL